MPDFSFDLPDGFTVAPITLSAQSICTLGSRRPFGMFTRVLVNDKEFGVVPPEKYRLLTDRNRLSVQLSVWTFRQISLLHPDFVTLLSGGFLTIYVPAKLLADKALFKALDGVVASGKLPANRLVLELSSDILYENAESVNSAMDILREKYGVSFLLSEYGGEYCPALRLSSFHFDYVMTDTVICNEESASSSAVKSAVQIAKENGATVIFGFANEKLLAVLAAAGFDAYLADDSMTVPDGRFVNG